MATRKLPKVTEYVKNVGKSIVFASIDSVKEHTPGINSFLEANNDIFKEVYSSVKNYKDTYKKIDDKIKSNNIFQAVNIGVKNLIEDAKTGKFYNDRTAEYAESALGLEDDEDFSFDDDYSSSSDDRDSDSFSDAIGAAAVSQNTMVAKGTEMVVKNNQVSTKLVLGGIERVGATISSSIGSVYSAVDKANQFLNGPLVAHMENSRRYYEESLKSTREMGLMLKELLEMQRNLYKEKSSGYKESKFDKSVRIDGSVDIAGYTSIVKSNMKNLLDSFGGGMLDMDLGAGSNPLLLMAAAPLKTILGPLVGSMFPKDFKSALKSFDKGITSMFSSFLAKMNTEKKRGYGLLSTIAGLFGIDLDVKDTINAANYKKDAIPFDGITRQAIIETIPGYLARIESALTGSGERHYDFQSGTWRSAKSIQKSFESEKTRAITNANYEIKSDIDSFLSEKEKLNPKLKKRFKQTRKSVDNMLERIFMDGGDFRPIGDGGSLRNGKDAWKYYGFASKADFEFVYNHLQRKRKDLVRDLSMNNMRARQDLSASMRQHEEKGGVYRHLFNGAYDNDGLGSGSYKDPSGYKYRKMLDPLVSSRDSSGKNVFWYLREILNTIQKNHNRSNQSSKKSSKKYYKREKRSSSSNSGANDRGGESSSDDEPDDFSDSVYEEIKAQKAKEQSEQEEKNRFGTWLNEKFGSRISKLFNNAGNLLASPMKYMTKLLNAADKSVFELVFGSSTLKDRNGKPIKSVFHYISDIIKKTFDDIGDWFKKQFGKVKNWFSRFTKPVFAEAKDMTGKAANRAKTAVKNTFGKGIESVIGKLGSGEVVSADDIENSKKDQNIDDTDIVTSAAGRFVTKRGLTMISPGEIIIPASFDKKEQQKMLALEKRDRRRIVKSIGLNAKGTVNVDTFIEYLKKIYNENKGNGSKVAAGGLLGGASGLIFGHPLIGAVSGAGISILNNSKTLQNIVFGDIVKDKDGKETRKGGLIPKKIQDIFAKAIPDMTDFGVAGGLLGLLTPFGPLGGAAIGAGIGFLKNNEKFKSFLFGELSVDKDGNTRRKGGLIKEKNAKKIKEFMKKSMPGMAIGAGIGILTGPFGLLGNAAMGAGLGLLANTDKFKSILFGDDKKGTHGLMGSIHRGIMEPAKEKINEILDDFKNFAKKNIIDPTKNFWDPFKQTIKNTIQNIGNGIKDHLNDMFEKKVGLPVHDFLQEKIFKPATKWFFRLLKVPLAIGKGIIAAPFRALGAVGNSMRMSQIRRGTASDMTAAQRLDFRDRHKGRMFFGNMFGLDRSLEEDRTIAGLDDQSLEELANNTNASLNNQATLQRYLGKKKNALSLALSKFFNAKDASGRIRYDVIRYNVANKIEKAVAEGDTERAEILINQSNLLVEDKTRLIAIIRNQASAISRTNKALQARKKSNEELDNDISRLLGRKINGRKDRRRLNKYLETELAARRKASEEGSSNILESEANMSTQEKISKEIKDTYEKNSETIIDHLKNINEYLRNLVEKKSGKKKKKTSVSVVPVNEDPDGKELTEERAEDIESEDVEERQANATEGTQSWMRRIYEKLFKDNGKSKKGSGGLLGRIGSAIGGLFKFIAPVGKIALGAGGLSLLGFASEWMKTSVWPQMKEFLFGKKDAEGNKITNGLLGGFGDNLSRIFLGEDGKSGLFGKIKTWIDDKLDGVKKWWESKGGLGGIIVNDVLPKMIQGWGYAMDNIVTPLTAMIIKHLPSMLLGLAKGILQGLKMAIFNKELPNSNRGSSVSIDSSAALKDISNMSAQRNAALETSMGSFTNSIKAVGTTASNSAAYTAAKASELNVNEIFATEKSANNEKKGFWSIFGGTKRSNNIEYDENGNITTNYTQMNSTDSATSRLGKVSLRGLWNGIAGTGSSKIGDVISGIGKFVSKHSKGFGSGIKKFGTKGIGKAAGKGLDATGNLMNSSINLGQWISGNIRNQNQISNAAKKISEITGASYDDVFKSVVAKGPSEAITEILEKTGKSLDISDFSSLMGASVMAENADTAIKSSLKGGNFLKNTVSKIKNKNLAKKIAKATGEKADDVLKNISTNGIDDVVKGVVSNNKISKTASKAVSKAASSASKAAKAATDAVDGNIIKKGLSKIFESLANSKIGAKILQGVTVATTKEAAAALVKEAFEKICNKITNNLLKKAVGAAGKAVTAALSAFPITAIVTFVTDFLWGFDNADTIFGVAKGDAYELNFGQKCVAGLVHLITNKFTFGLIPAETIMDIVIEFLLPLFGINTDELNAARDRATAIMDEWNAANPEETYDNLQDFNNKDKWFSKAKKWFKKTKTYNSIKGVFSDTKDAISNVFNAAKSGNIKDAIKGASDIVGKFTKPFGFIIEVVKKGFEDTLSSKGLDTLKAKDDQKIEKAKNGELSVFSSEYWKNEDYGGKGILGGIINVAMYIEKAFSAPIAIIKSIGKKISDTFTKIKDWLKDKFKSVVDWFKGDNKSTSSGAVSGTSSGVAQSGSGRLRRRLYGRGHIYQTDPSISNLVYGDSTIGVSGCAPVAVTNAMNNIRDGSMDVASAAKYAVNNGLIIPGGGTDISYISSFLNAHGIATQETTDQNSIIEAAQNGNQIIMLGQDKKNGSKYPFGKNPHFITVTGTDNKGYFLIEDPALNSTRVKHSQSKVFKSMKSSIILDNQITAPKSNSANNLMSELSNLGTSILKNIYGDAYNAFYNNSETSEETSGGSRMTGMASKALGSRNYSETRNYEATPASIDYATFLETIVTILMSIADNTSLLTKIIELLSSKFDLNEKDKSDIEVAAKESKAKTKAALNDLIRRSTNNTTNASKLINNRDTNYIVSVMRAIAGE